MKKILFISHDASRTGAPILLLNLVKWIKNNKKDSCTITILCVDDGPLMERFALVSETFLLNKKINFTVKKINNFLKNNHKNKLYKKLDKTKWDVIFSNTIVNGEILKKLATKKTPIISYIHELDYSIDLFIKRGNAEGTLTHSDFFICGSKLVQHTLVNKFDVDKIKTKVVYSFIEFEERKKDLNLSSNLKEEYNIPKNNMVVGMVGTFDWRKGADLFVKTASLLSKENIHFIWIGADNQNEINKNKYDLEKSNSNANISFIPSTPEYLKYYNIIDVFFLSSREDPYPLAMIDATSFGIPIICFENAGGTQEFINSKVGFILPYGNTSQVADKINLYNKNRKLLVENSAYIKEKSLKTHNVDVNASQIYDVIERLINK